MSGMKKVCVFWGLDIFHDISKIYLMGFLYNLICFNGLNYSRIEQGIQWDLLTHNIFSTLRPIHHETWD